MRSSARPISANAIADPGRAVARFIEAESSVELLRRTHVDWQSGVLIEAPADVLALLLAVNGIAKDQRSLLPSGLRLLGKLQIDLESAAKTSGLSERFEIDGTLAQGSTSIALRAVNKSVGRTVVLKVLRPSQPDVAQQAIRRLGQLESIPHLVAPIDAVTIDTKTCSGDNVQLYGIVFPFIPAVTLGEYLRRRPPVAPYFFEALIRQVGGVLEGIESRGSRHGDLHAANILVSAEDPTLEFTVIDPSPNLGDASPYTRQASDFEWFQEHLGTALLVLQRQLPSISIQKHLGPRLFSVINRLQRARRMQFREVLRLLDTNPRYEQWLRDRALFLAAKFKEPQPLGLLRWEEIADPAQAVELFEPYPELFRRIRGFGNSLVVGARGSGKSTYLAALAYFPEAKKRLVDASEVFGLLFSCRQGEFKQLSKDFLPFDAASRLAIKHVLVLKIIRRAMGVLAASSESGELTPSGDMKAPYDFVRSYMEQYGSVPRVNTTATAALSNLAAAVVRWEELEIRRLFDRSVQDISARLLDEHALFTFCGIVRALFSDLATTQFYFLFDDAGEPNIPREAQQVLNDLLTSSNAVYCVKLSAERFSYDLLDSRGRTLEETHDFTSFDIASVYATEGGFGQSRDDIRDYFTNIVRRRLEHWNYPSTDIGAYLGDQLTTISVRELVMRLAAGRKNAYYAGWDVVWQLADKTPRNLIELVSEIFAHARVRPPNRVADTSVPLPQIINARVQDRAIRAVSNRRLRGLEFIPGEITIRSRPVPLGKHLYLCASSFGAISHKYLTASHADERLDERLAIERNDTSLLRSEAQAVLNLLVRYGIFDDSGLNVAFDDGQKKPVYVFNRVFCPAFGISFRRDAHLRLSSGKLEQFLLDPAAFVERGTAFLKSGKRQTHGGRLWETDGDE
jgi:hypothetical protein